MRLKLGGGLGCVVTAKRANNLGKRFFLFSCFICSN